MKKTIQLFKDTFNQWIKHEPFQQGAIIAYYTLFSLPSLMVIIISVVGYFFGKSTVQGEIIQKLGEFLGQNTAASIQNLMTNVNVQQGTTIAIVISVVIIVFAASGAFFQLKKSINKIWGVREKKSNVLRMLFNRLISLAMILIIGGLMIGSIIATSLITILGKYINQIAPEITSTALIVFNYLFQLVFLAVLFAIVFKLLSDVKVSWKVTFVGAAFTTVLFLLAVYGLSIYFEQSNPASVFGGASSVILIMLWIYYSCLVLFLGVEFTVQYAELRGAEVSLNRHSEPAIIQELKDLKERKTPFKGHRNLIKKLVKEVGQEKE